MQTLAMRVVVQLTKIDRELRFVDNTRPLAVFAPRGSGKTTLVSTIANASIAGGHRV